ncbi:ParB N-terminal domain-containing protein [Gemmata sp. G18]|uniref:ParB N-terminal domain-containing protein n=1 Tax=Gemmata palustris TaxID=2822762 RepID=A0ABS5BM78_9BACT|nr:ParB N-terminal domain-containing protein [Gemmata palustris]MBP3953998.1 ParB N-terminal domain-containing protein [Gemmata palustris]
MRIAEQKRPSGRVRTAAAIEEVALDSLIPAPINDVVYSTVDPTDPDIRALAKKICQQGLLEPIVITLDDVILSGHRRRVACQLARLKTVKVRRQSILSTDPGFLDLLVNFNEQRAKSIPEVIREKVATADKGAAYANLLANRRAQADRVELRCEEAGLQLLAPGAARKRASISPAKRPMLDAAVRVLNANRDYWPLTLRQVHYRLLNHPPLRNAGDSKSTYSNNQKSYKDLSDLLTRARLSCVVPWNAVYDPTRPQTQWECWRSPRPFVKIQVDEFLGSYHRDLLQSQPAYIEVIGEKMTIQTFIILTVVDYCIPYTIGRGYSSIDTRYQLAQRFQASGKDRMVLSFLSDLDPEGENIPDTFASSMRDEFGVYDITAVKVALTPDQVARFKLPPLLTAKESSSRTAGFVAEHGDAVYELEAVEPDQLANILRAAVESVLDMPLFRTEQEREAEDATVLDAYRDRAMQALGDVVRTSPD